MRLRNISGTITRVMLSLSLAITIAIATLNNQSTTVQADHVGDIITAVVNSMSSESKAGTATIPNGVSQARTGYLCYLIKPDGSNYSTNAIALYSPGFIGLSESSWIAKTRTNLTAGSWKGQADWNCTPWTSSGTSVISHEPEIKQYFQDKNDTGVEHSLAFVKKYWGDTAAHAFEKDECYIVIETLMNFQYSEPGSGSGTLTSEQQTEIWNKCKEQAIIEANKLSDPVQELEDEGANITDLQAIWKKRFVKGDYIVRSWSDYCRSLLIQKWTAEAAEGAKRELKDTLGSARKMIGTPLIGTVPNLISAKSELGTTTTVFNSYLNNAACHAEQLQKSEAGFTVGASSGVLSDSEVATQGVAMMIIHYNDTSIQSTCDEPLQPDPHDPPDESTGDVSIVKNYRTKDGDDTYTDDGCFIRNNLSNEIMIEDETDYKVVGWKATGQTSPETIDSINWNPPGTVGQTGDTVGTVTLDETKEHTLYVLLEKSQDTPVTPPETPDYDYLLTETQITKQSKLSSPDNFVNVPTTLLQFKFSRDKFECNGHHVPTKHDGTHGSDCAEGCAKDHSFTCKSGCSTHTYYCTWRSWTDNSIKYSIKNTNWDAYKTILVTKAGATGVEVKRGENTKWTVSLSEGTKTDYYKNDGGNYWTWPGGDSHYSSDKDEWDYLFLLARGDDKLTVAQWVNAGEAKPVNGTDGTFSDANTFLEKLAGDDTYFTVASKKSSADYSRYKDDEHAKLDDLSQGKTGYYIKKFNMKFDKDTVTSGVDYDVSANPSAGSTGGTCTLQTITYGLVNGDGTTYSKGPLEIKDITVKIEVYTGQETLDPDYDYDYDTSDKIVFKNSRAIQKHTTSGIMVPTNTEIKFTPYVRMKYDTLTTTDLTAYVLGEYERSITPNDYAEIEWDYYNKDGIYNLQINSSQWSTHAQAYKDYGSGGKVLPGGATLSLKETDDGRRTLKVRTYQTILQGKGLTQVLNTTGTTTNPLPESDSSGNIVVKRHDDYANSVVEALSQTMIRQYVSTNASLENPMDVCVDSNVVNPDSNINLNNGSSKTSSESKYYLRTEDEYKEKSNSARLDATITSTSETGRYTFRADYKGNIYMNDKFILSKNQSYTDLKDATAKELDDKTYIVRKLLAAIQRDGGNDTSAKWVTDGHWYNEAMDGITIVVRESTIKTGLWNPAERHMVLDPKLIPSAEKNGSKVQNTKGTLFNCYFSSAFRTDNYSTKYGASSQEKIGEFKSRDGKAYSVKLTEYKTLYVSDKVFYIPNVTTQDLN
jgi:hypothetical protein